MTIVLYAVKSWIVEMIILIWKNLACVLLHRIIIWTILLCHHIVSWHLVLTAYVLLGVHWIKLALTLLKDHATLIKVIIVCRIIFVNCIERVAMWLLVTLDSFVATSLLIHLLMVFIIYVVTWSSSILLATLTIILRVERACMTTTSTMIWTKMTCFSALHLILDELFLHLVLFLDNFHFLLQ